MRNKRIGKRIVRFLHEWLGLSSGLIVFVVALSGTLFVFCDEVIDVFAGEAKYVNITPNQQKLPASILLQKFKEAHPERSAFYFDTYTDATRTFRVASEKNDGEYAYTYINPYTGEVLKTSKAYWFFYIVAARIHSQLFMSSFGETIVGISAIIFLLELIGGLILWFPAKWNKKSRAASFTIKSKTKWKRKVYDLHKVLGFYVLIPALLITVTGLIMAYSVLDNLTQKSFGGTTNVKEIIKENTPKYDESKTMKSLDVIVSNFTHLFPDAKQMRFSVPFKKEQTSLRAMVADKIGLKTNVNGTMLFANRYTGVPIEMPKKVAGQHHVEQTVFNLHVGHWWGITGKIITFIVGLICTSLPVTGFLFWLSRKRKRT